MTRFLLRLLLAVIVAILVAAYYHIIFPADIAYFIGAAFGVIELLSPLLVSRFSVASGAVRAFSFIFQIGAAFILWPALAWIMSQIIPAPHAIAASAGFAAAAGIFAAGHGQNRDTMRHAAAISSAAVAGIAVMQATLSGEYLPAMFACISSAAALFAIKSAIIWPERQRAYFDYAIIAVIFAALADGILGVILQ